MTLNQHKGAFVGKSMPNSTSEEFTKALTDIKLRYVDRMKVMKEGKLVETDGYIITFYNPDQPQAVKKHTCIPNNSIYLLQHPCAA